MSSTFFGLYAVINFDTTMKADHMYMTLEQSKQNIKTHHSASNDYTQTIKTSKHTWMWIPLSIHWCIEWWELMMWSPMIMMSTCNLLTSWLSSGTPCSIVTPRLSFFVCMLRQKYFGCHVGFWFQCRPSSWCPSNELSLNWSTAFRNQHHLLPFAYGFASMSGDPVEQCWNIILWLSVLTCRLASCHYGG
jgi:hypothetical protein